MNDKNAKGYNRKLIAWLEGIKPLEHSNKQSINLQVVECDHCGNDVYFEVDKQRTKTTKGLKGYESLRGRTFVTSEINCPYCGQMIVTEAYDLECGEKRKIKYHHKPLDFNGIL